MIRKNCFIAGVFLLELLLAAQASCGVWANQNQAAIEITNETCKRLIDSGGVFVFFDPACPICAEYFPTLEKLSAKYNGKQNFYLVFKADDSGAINGFVDGYHPHSFVLSDKNSLLLAKLRPRVTPEVFVVHKTKVVYSGRIDDRYASIGHRRNVIRSNDLDAALTALAAGELPGERSAPAVGCYIEGVKEDSGHEGK